KVVGKIDLDSFGKSKSKKTTEEQVEKQSEPAVAKVEEVPAKEEKVKVEPAATVEEVKTEPAPVEKTVVAEEKPKPEEATGTVEKQQPIATPAAKEQPDEVIRTKYEKLEGPKVIGKIELPTFKPKDKPVASSSKPNQDSKRKRKRTNKPGAPVSSNDQTGQGNAPGQGGHARGPQQGGPRTDNRGPHNR